MSGVENAKDYFKNGWPVLPLPANAKSPPPDGRTGYEGIDMTLAEIESCPWDGNIGVRMPVDVIGLDVDVYRGGREGLDRLRAECGPLPYTWISHSGRNDGSGIRFYRVPPQLAWISTLPGIDIIQRNHRYACVYPSMHPDGRQYGWWDQSESAPTFDLPSVENLPELPWSWIEELSRPDATSTTARAVSSEAALVFIDTHDTAERRAWGAKILERFLERTNGGYSRHDTMQHCLIWSMECARAGIISASVIIAELGDLWIEKVKPDARRMELWSDRRTTEFQAMLRHAIGKAEDKPDAEILRLHDDVVGIPFNVPPKPDPVTVDYQPEDETALYRHGVVDGAAFVLDQSTAIVARWGKGADVLWAQGESMMLCGPTGVGKTTIAGQLVGGLIGVLPDVLGFPVKPAERTLYLAMDRPRQIQRALRRLFNDTHRTALSEHLIVRRGPLPKDLGRHPEILVTLAQQFECEVVILDSLKDAAVKLSDDEVAGSINRAIQFCNVEDIDVLVLHHQRKSVEGKKPTSLEDVYGNTWITAGAGSVILLWGDPGSEIVELSHLKQPAEVIGPLTIEHDHHRGTSVVTHGWDALTWLRIQGPGGGTIAQAAQAHHGAAQTSGSRKWKQTERRLRALVEAGLATATGQIVKGQPGRFVAVVAPQIAVAGGPVPRGQPRGQGGSGSAVDSPVDDTVDNLGLFDEEPAQPVDNLVDTD